MLLGFPLAFWITAVLAVLLIGVAKGGFGGGVGVAATPLLALTLPVGEAAALLLPLLIAADVVAVYHYRKRVSRAHLLRLLPGALLGVLLGALFLGQVPERALKAGIGALAIGFVAFQLVRRRLLERLAAGTPSPAWAAPLGALSGFASTLAHAGGPPVTIYLLPQRLPRERFVGTNAVFFFVLNLVKLIPYALLGLLAPDSLRADLVLLPVVPLGVALGIVLNRAVSERAFGIVVHALLLLSGLELLSGASLLGWLLGRLG